MRILLTALAILATAAAQAGTLTKVRDHGPDGNRVVVLVIAEGYTAAQEADFVRDATASLDGFFASAPWSAYERHANAYIDFVASNESGADKPAPCFSPEVFRDTAFGASYCGAGSRRLLIVNFGAAWTEATSVLPAADLVAVLVNDAEYGGAGGSLLTFSNNASARTELFLHEHGHTFANLADEYTTPYPGFPPGDGEPNVDFDAARGSIDWDPWILPATPVPTPAGNAEVGCFEGARYLTNGIYRPRDDCKMRSLGRGFCEVCGEAVVQSIYALMSPIDAVTPPVAGDVGYDPCTDATLPFGVTPVLPQDPSWIRIEWLLDGVPLAETGPSLALSVGGLGPGPHELTVRVRDETPLVRRPYLVPMSDEATWTLRASAGPDRDGDGVSDACDCAPDDGSAWGPPGEAGGVRVRFPGDVSWAPAASSHDVARGLVSALRAGYDGACFPVASGASLSDGDLPGERAAFWYLVRALNDCGLGPWGPRSDGVERSIAACP